MNRTVPGATNWPEDRRKARLKVKRSGLHTIEEKRRDALGELIHQVREFRACGQKLDGYVAAFKLREPNGDVRWKLQARGGLTLPEQMALSRSLTAWLEKSD